MAKSEREQYTAYVATQLSRLSPFLQQYAMGDFSETIPIPEKEDEFTELFVGLNLMVDDIREMLREKEETIAKLHEQAKLERLIKERTAELHASEERFRQVVENMPVMVDAFDQDFHICLWNRECERVTGYTADEIIGNPRALEVLYPDEAHRDQMMKAWSARTDHYYNWEWELTCKDGTHKIVSWSNISKKIPIPGWATWGVGVDVTKRKQAEEALQRLNHELEQRIDARTRELQETQEKLLRREKLVVLGQMAGSVGHELRTPLAAISNAVYYLNMVLADADDAPQKDAAIREYLDIVASEIRKAERIVTDLLGFSRVKPGTRACVVVADLVDQVLAKHEPPDTIQVTTTIADDVPPVFVDALQVEQILTNVITNAYQAMPNGAELTIWAVTENEVVALAIRDTGCGISEENLPKLFEPLFTTKAKGIGLGLALSKTLVEANGGTIEMESQEGQGSTFTVILPGLNKESAS